MAAFRCPQCQTPMTEEELRAGVCQVCEAPVEPPPPTAARAAEPKTQPDEQPRFTTGALVGAAFSLVAFCFLPVGLMFYFSLPEERPAEKKAAQKPPTIKPQPVAEGKKPADKEMKAVEDDAKKPAPDTPPEEKKKEEVKPSELKKDEPKKIEKPKKIEEPKVVEKKADPKPAPLVNKRRFMALPLLSDEAIKIDGDLSDWKDIPPITLQAVERGKPTKKIVASPKTQKAYVAYCSRGILIAVDVVDTSGELENAAPALKNTSWAFWDNDAIEVFIDTLNIRPRERGDPSVHQFFAFPFGTGNDNTIGGYESRMLKLANGRLNWAIMPQLGVGKTGMLRAAKKTAAGWSMELLIPKSALRQGDLKPGQVYGFEVQLDTGTNLFYFWANDNNVLKVSTNPSRWGEALLAGTDAKLEVLGADGKPAKSFAPGQPLTVRVTDLDMNLNAAVKEKLNVTLVSKAGDRKTLLLEETGVNTGVFVGTIATRLNGGRRETTVLDTLADDTVIVEYLDTIRADGERNVSVRISITAQGR